MRRSLSLRARVATWFGGLGVLLCGLFAVATLVIAEGFEHILVAELLDDAAATRFEAQARSRYFRVYSGSDAPNDYRDLPAGIHEFEDGRHSGLHVGVYEEDGERIFVVMELGEIERLERYLAAVLAVIVLGGGLLAGALGWTFSGSAIRPVRILASGLASLPGRPVRTRFAQANEDDILGPIAMAIDTYLQRLHDADDRERRFYADASHELRTPITVIKGAAEILAEDPDISDSQRGRLARIERAVAKLAVLLDAILLAARDTPAHGDRFTLGEWLDAGITRVSVATHLAKERLRIEGHRCNHVVAPRRWADALIDVLLLRLVAAPSDVEWRIVLGDDGIDLHAIPTRESESPALAERADLGVSLRLAERLAASFGWKVTSHSGPTGLVIAVRAGTE